MSKRYRLDEQHKKILDANRYLLVKNVIHTPELHARLLSDKVVTETMLRDIQNVIHTPELHARLLSDKVVTETMLRDIQEGKTQQEQNERLINVLKLRNKNAFRKFTYILLFTGHSLLADFLHDEDKPGTQYVNAGEIERRIPSVASCLGLDDMKRLCHYVESKIKGAIAKKTWNASEREKDRIEEIRKEHYHQEEEKQRSLERCQQKVSELESRLEQAFKDTEDKDQKIKELKTTISQSELDHKENLSKQMRFNTANNSTITKLSERLAQYARHVTELTTKLQQSMGEILKDHDVEVTYTYGSGILGDGNKGKPEDRRKMAELDSVISLLLRVAQNFSHDIKEVETTRTKEKDTILALLGTNPREKDLSTTDALRMFINKENKEKQHLLRDIQTISAALKEDKGTKSQNEFKPGGVTFEGVATSPLSAGNVTFDFRSLRSTLGMLREEIQHISKRLQWKEAQMKALEEENAELKSGVLFRGRRLGTEEKPEALPKNYSATATSPLKHKTSPAKNRYLTGTPRKPAETLSGRRKQRVLSPIEETPHGKPTNSIVFPSLDPETMEPTKPISNRA
ncbi:putative leucine-rich repeat-containing protein DDB_G0290503 [Liolophura sinensis]|uniref:putative leucine-rich repeat-containing protein DDB_G0290503 n=1 Tax=Liolophura sinensis TaxID=3198878 RepID=UPI00315900D1